MLPTHEVSNSIEDKKNSVLTGDGDHSSSYSKNYSTNSTSLTIPESVVQQINAISPEELAAHSVLSFAKTIGNQQSYVCPACDNGTGEDATGIVPNFNGSAWLYHCFKCGASFNNIQLLALYYGLDFRTEFKEVCRRVCTDFGIYLESATAVTTTRVVVPKTKIANNNNTQLIQLLRKDIKFAQEHLEELPKKARRGLTIETLRHFGCGYIKDWTSAYSRLDGKFATPTPRLIIPSGDHYLARLTVPLENFDEKTQKYIQTKQHMGAKFPFAFDSISTSSPMNIIVEGEIDAMSIWQVMHGILPVIATSGATNYKKFIELLKEKFPEDKPKFLVLFDSDSTGKDAAPKLTKTLLEAGFPAVYHFLSDEESKVDANDILREQGSDTLVNYMADICNEAEYELGEINMEEFKMPKDIEDDEKLWFIANPAVRRDFIKLRNQPYSKERNKAMVQIIRDNLDWKIDKKTGERLYIFPSAKNFRNIFNNDPIIANLFGYEQFRGETVFLKKPFWQPETCINQQWTDVDDAHLRFYIREHYNDLSNKLTTDDIFTIIAHENRFNIVQKHFESLPKWDGVARAESLFIDFLKVADTPYARAVTKQWLLAALARIYYPGCNFQSALLLHGNQNIGKSYILEKLGGAWYGSLIDDVDDPHAVDAIRNIWICEMKEMAAARKSEINATKSFIERPADTYRAAYARRASTFLRHCVFAITVNDSQPLRDQTGNRRYWILESPLAEFDIVEENERGERLADVIPQIWAEMLVKFKELTKDGFNEKILELPKGLKQQAEKVAEKFTVNDGLQNEVEAFLDTPILVPALWKSLTKEERRAFFSKKSITLDEGDWKMRRLALTEKERAEFDAALADETHVRRIEIPRGKDNSFFQLAVYGSVKRQETCSAEIYNEFFNGGDKRKQIFRINEILSKLNDWQKVEEQRRDFYGYGNQKRFYRRSIISADIAQDSTKDVPLPF